MKNELLIKEKLLSVGLTLGCYDAKLDKLSQKDLRKLLDRLEFGSTDVGVTKYIVEVSHVDNEVDINVITPAEYAKTYGRIFAGAN